ncbi:MAG TPA: hypothetical protein VHC48_19540 [Puia sp.]|nr:hypothetical protein [Puia sp.]
MRPERNFIWVKLIWSVVIIVGFTLLSYIRYIKSGSIIGFDIYPYILDPYILALSLIITLIRLLSHGLSPGSFVYILTGVTNAFIGGIGIYLNASSQVSMSYVTYGMFLLNLLLAAFIFYAAYDKRG